MAKKKAAKKMAVKKGPLKKKAVKKKAKKKVAKKKPKVGKPLATAKVRAQMPSEKPEEMTPDVAKEQKLEQDLLDYLAKVTKRQPEVSNHGPANGRIQVAKFMDYPDSGLTTFVTLGASRLCETLYRGLDSGFELTLTLAKANAHAAENLATAVLENKRRADSGERRPFIEYNGVYAPGYPPHFLFTTYATSTPKLSGQKRFGDRWVEFMTAIHLDDAELRAYESNVPALIAQLQRGGRIADYPRG